MDFSEGTVICRFCLGKFTENYAPIEDVQPTLNFLTLYPNLAISDNPMICETCAASMTKCFDFKTRCLSTDDYNAPFADGGDKKVDIKEIYANVKQDVNLDRVSDYHNVCRLCLELVKYHASMSVGHDADLIVILQKYFLELDLKITDDTLVCLPCYNSLRFYASFVNNYMNIEKKIYEYCQVEGLNYKGQVDLRDVETFISKSLLNIEDISSSLIIKEEELDIVDTKDDVKLKFEDPMDVGQEENLIDKEVQQENRNSFQHPIPPQSDGEPQTTDYLKKHKYRNTTDIVAGGNIHKCELCDYEGKREYYLKKHMLVHKTPSEVTMFKCKLCDYESKRNFQLKSHMLTHKSPSEIIMYTCDLCDYNTKDKFNLNKHMLTHKTPSEITMYKCNLCDYKTKWKFGLKQHMLIHKTPLEITMYKCGICHFETKHRTNLNKHMIIHKALSEITTYKCDMCNFETRYKNCLQPHMLLHKNLTEIEMHKCKECSFKTKQKKLLRKHVLTQRVPPGTIYTCNLCGYEAKLKCSLKEHKRSHKINVYKCPLCDFETKQKVNLKRHMLTHKTPSEVTMYKCDLCDYEAKLESELKGHILIHETYSEVTIIKHELPGEVDVVQPEDTHTSS